MTAHFPLDELAAALREDGVTVHVLPGAQGRSARKFTNGYYGGCQGSCVHHTGSSGTYPNNDIQYLLNGKGEGYVISNVYTARNGEVTLIASGPTYTEGAGGPLGIIPKDRGNDFTFSNEVAGGLGPAFPYEQTTSVMLVHYHVNRIAARVWNWPDNPWGPDRLFAHFEWAPGRKVDPKGDSPWSTGYTMWDMDAFRADMIPLHELDQRPPDTGAPRMKTIRIDGYADQFGIIALSGDSKRRNGIPDGDADIIVKPTVPRAELERILGYKLTPA